MEQVNFGYSLKNIPLPNKKEYKLSLISSAEKFIQSIRWRTYFYLNPDKAGNRKETFGFKSSASPPNIPELKSLEDGMLNIVKNVQFINTTGNDFQRKLKNDIKMIQSEDKVYVSADKTNNFYKKEPANYIKLLDENITKTYKKTDTNTVEEIQRQDKVIATKLDIEDRMYATTKNQACLH
jgi:hypothetical protein